MINAPTTLTIGIPTYNGSAYIQDTINSIVSQLNNETKTRVDVLISDNASSDNTSIIISTATRDTPAHITYIKNATNIGFDKNVDSIFKRASGQYVWILADDDALTDGALDMVLSVLDNNPGLMAIQINFDQYDREMVGIVDRIQPSKNGLCTNASEFLLHAESRYTQVSSLVINKNAWNNEDLSNGIGSNFIHVYALMKLIMRGNSYIIQQAMIKVRMGSTKTGTSGDSILGIALDAGEIVNSMHDMGHDKVIVNKLLINSRRYAFDTLLIAKTVGIKDIPGAARRLISTFNSPQLWIKGLPILYCPVFLIRITHALNGFARTVSRPIEQRVKSLLRQHRGQ